MVMANSFNLSEREWQLAHIVAQQLVLAKADANELGKAKSYLRVVADQADAGQRFFRYLETLAKQGDRIGHSKQTKEYYDSMSNICQKYLQEESNNIASLMQIVGWSFRLMRYYKDAMPLETLREVADTAILVDVPSARQAEISQAIADVQIEEGSVLDSVVAAIKGNKVTYEMFGGAVRLTQKEPKKADSLSEGQSVKVEVTELKEDGGIKKVKLLD